MKDHFAGLAAAAAASGRSGMDGFPAGLPLLSHMQVPFPELIILQQFIV
jgi:hypothetical protein